MKSSSSSTTRRLCSLRDMPHSAPEDVFHEVSLEEIVDRDSVSVDLDEVLGDQSQPHRTVLKSVDETLGLFRIHLEGEDRGGNLGLAFIGGGVALGGHRHLLALALLGANVAPHGQYGDALEDVASERDGLRLLLCVLAFGVLLTFGD